MTELETNLTTGEEQRQAESSEVNPEIKPDPCQGYKVDPITKLHLCTVCEYHKYRNESKPWLKKTEEQA